MSEVTFPLPRLAAAVLAWLVVLVMAVPSGWAAGPPCDAPLRVKEVEIKGVKVRLPIPDGYEEMQREDHPETYDWMVKVTEGIGQQPLAYLINAADREALRSDPGVNIRFATAAADDDSWDAVIKEDSMERDREYFIEYVKDIWEGFNEVAREENRIERDYVGIYDGKKSVSALYIGKNKLINKKYKSGLSISFIVLDKKVVEFTFFHKIFFQNDSFQLIHTTLNYLKNIDQGCY